MRPPSPSSPYRPRPVNASVAHPSEDDLLLGDDGLRTAGQLYLTWCHRQPLALFDSETFLDSLPYRDRQLQLALQALSLRFPPGSLTDHKRERLSAMAKASHRHAMDTVLSSRVSLSTLQALCLLSMIEFAGKEFIMSGIVYFGGLVD